MEDATWSELVQIARRFDAELGGLGPNHDRPLLDVASPAISLRVGDGPAAGWFAGAPALRSDGAWPVHRGVRMTHVATLDLEAVAHLQTNLLLPGSGYLSFFFDEFDPDSRADQFDRSAIVFTPTGTLAATSAGSPPAAPFTASQIWTVPDIDEIDDAAGWGDDERGSYYDLVIGPWHEAQGLNPNGESEGPGKRHQVGGWPDPIQGPVAREIVAEVLRELGPSAPSDHLDRNAWCLLLQIVYDVEIERFWGDAGTLYFAMIGERYDPDGPTATQGLMQDG